RKARKNAIAARRTMANGSGNWIVLVLPQAIQLVIMNHPEDGDAGIEQLLEQIQIHQLMNVNDVRAKSLKELRNRIATRVLGFAIWSFSGVWSQDLGVLNLNACREFLDPTQVIAW